jgi:tetratricopeptide (TPR) repeat protein
MSLIMDALKKAQQQRLKEPEGDPFFEPPLSPQGAMPGTQGKRKIAFLSFALLGLAALLGLIFWNPWALSRQGKEGPPIVAPQTEKAALMTTGEESPKSSLPRTELPEERRKASSLEERREPMKRPETPKLARRASAPIEQSLSIRPPPEPSPQGAPPEAKDAPDPKAKVSLSPLNRPVSIDLQRLFNQGVHEQSRGQISKAIDSYQKVVEADPSYYEAFNNLGLLYQEGGDLKRAAEAYEKALEVRPDYVKALNNLGVVRYLEDRDDEAMDCFQRALSISPDHVESHLHLGLLLKKRGRWKEALEAFERALRLNPLHGETHYNLALLLEELHRIEGAIEHYEKFIRTASSTHPELAGRVQRHLGFLQSMKTEPSVGERQSHGR